MGYERMHTSMHEGFGSVRIAMGTRWKKGKKRKKEKGGKFSAANREAYKSSIDYKEKASRWWKRIKGDGGLARMHVLHPSIRPDKSPFADGLYEEGSSFALIGRYYPWNCSFVSNLGEPADYHSQTTIRLLTERNENLG